MDSDFDVKLIIRLMRFDVRARVNNQFCFYKLLELKPSGLKSYLTLSNEYAGIMPKRMERARPPLS